MRSKKAQEEMVGFALIIIIVAVILLFFLSFAIKKQDKEAIESYEVEGFIHSMLQYTTSCEMNQESNFQSLRKVIQACSQGKECLDGKDSCQVLREDAKRIMEESWKTGEDRPLKGYNLDISSLKGNLINMTSGNETSVYKQSSSILDDSETEVRVKVYY